MNPPPMRPGTPPQSEPSLSEAARHVVLPTGITSTGWPAVRDKCRDLGIKFQRWQDGAGRCILAKREDGLYAAGIGGVVMSIPRQVGKTFLMGAIVFALCLMFPNLTVLWTAHRVRTANETFRSMQAMARRKLIKPYVERVLTGSGTQSVEFKNGSRILFGARENGFGRGIPDIGVIVFDEAQILTDDALDDMVPAANQATNPLVIFTGTPPKPTDPGEVFTRLRAKALAGESENILLIEFSADPSTDPAKWPKGFIDWVQIAKANPSFPKWTPRAAILRMLELLGLASFRLEGLGIWLDSSGPQATIQRDAWAKLATANPPSAGRVALGVKFSMDGKRVALAAARRPAGGVAHVEVLGVWSAVEGVAKVRALLAGDSWRSFCAVVVDGKAGAGALVQSLADDGVSSAVMVLPMVPEVMTAHSMMLNAVESATVTNGNQPGLNGSVAAATQRKIGTAGGWGWAPIGDGDVLPIEAATFALWGVSTATFDNFAATMPRRIY